MRNLTLAQWSLAFCSWHKCPALQPLPFLTVLTLQRSLLGAHWAMHEPSGPLSVLHSSETCTESTTVCSSSSFSWLSQYPENLRRVLMQAVERDPRWRVLTPIWRAGKWATVHTSVSGRAPPVQNHARTLMQLTTSSATLSMCGNYIGK